MIASIKSMSDEELVRQFIDTQKDVYFEYLYDRYVDKVFRKCMSFVKDEAKAEDYTHDIFLKLVLSLGSYKENARFSTWLYSITYNFCIDRVRINKRMAEDELDENADFVDEELGAGELREMEAQRLRESLEQVAADDKSILLMKYQDDMSIREIAEIFNITESAVKMRLKRAKEKVKKVYLDNMLFWVVLATKALIMMRENIFWIALSFLFL